MLQHFLPTWSRFSSSSPWLCCMFLAVVLPSLFIACFNICTKAEHLDTEHLLQRSIRDINDDNNETDMGIDQQQQRQLDSGLSIGTFLGNLSSSARDQLYNIVTNPNMTKQQINDALDAWAQSQGQSFYTVYLGLKAAYEAARQQLDQQHAALMQNQSQAVRDADAKMQTIDNNQFITLAQEKQQMEQMGKFPVDVQQTLLRFAPYPYSKK